MKRTLPAAESPEAEAAPRSEPSAPVALSAAFAPEDLLVVPVPVAHATPPPVPGMRTALVTALRGRQATITLRGRAESIEAVVAPEVDAAVIADALENGDAVLVEIVAGEPALVVAALHTRRPRTLKLQGAVIHIEGDEEILLRSGQGAVRIRADGDIEVVGGRINAASRGLFRIVGRMLRLN